ncbi:MAG: catalase [Lachnospiraceae bacterium]|nr:catalase [Lachnospiraceae bacterium]
MLKLIRHIRTVNEHRRMVRRGCFRVGLYWQGLVHDLSKYSPSELFVGAKYYQGFRSPNNAEREAKGYSEAWIHHKGRNKHHYEYWTDYLPGHGEGESHVIVPTRMPTRYLVEMYVDRVAASAIYNKGHYTEDMPLKYFKKGDYTHLMEEHTRRELEKLLTMLASNGSEVTESYIRNVILKHYPAARIAEALHNRKRR